MEDQYPEVEYTGGQEMVKSVSSHRIPIRRKLEIRIKQKEMELTELKNALESLDKNPEYEKLHDILSKVSQFL